MHPVPQGLTVHAAGFGRRFAVHAIEHQRKRKYPTRRGTILLSARRLAKLRSREIKSSDRYRRSHRCRSSQRPASSQSFTDLGIPNESQFRAVGITRAWRPTGAHAPQSTRRFFFAQYHIPQALPVALTSKGVVGGRSRHLRPSKLPLPYAAARQTRHHRATPDVHLPYMVSDNQKSLE